ncbi:hypothetical protein, partial [Pseudomonas sp. 2995-1]
LYAFNNSHRQLSNYFNLLESYRIDNSRSASSLNIQSNFVNLLSLLHKKQTEERWSETDAELIDRMTSRFIDYENLISEERKQLSGLYNPLSLFTETASVTHSIDVNQMSTFFEEINRTSQLYLLYQRLPEEIEPLSEEDIIERLTYVLELDEIKRDEMMIQKDEFNRM